MTAGVPRTHPRGSPVLLGTSDTIRRMGSRVLGGAASSVAVFLVVMALSWSFGWATSVPAAVGAAAVCFAAVTRPRPVTLALVVVAATSASALATVVDLEEGYELVPDPEVWGLVEVGSLLLLLGAVVRWGPGPAGYAVAAFAGVTYAAWILRFVPDRSAGALAFSVAIWSTGAWVAAVVGGYPRFAASRLRRSVAEAQAHQRRQFERDLHDYVAHDISGILAQAQAAQYAPSHDPEALGRLLASIEGQAANAMAAMDRALDLLRLDTEEPTARRTFERDLGDLPVLLGAFADASSAEVTTHVSTGVESVPPPVSTAVHRVVVECLTNIRRHAPTARRVEVRVSVDPVGGVVCTVTNSAAGRTEDPRAGHPARNGTQQRRGGTGLTEAAAAVRALGGSFHAGPTPLGGWSVNVRVPAPKDVS